jgi:hypothetical protein
MKVFIDTNIYLKLFTPAGDQADYIGKLIALVKDRKNNVDIVFPKIIQNELSRHISDANEYKKNLETATVAKPALKDEFDKLQIEKIQKAYDSWRESIDELNKNYEESIKKVAERIFGEFRKNTIDFPEDEEFVKRAYFRKLKGYPPGKSNHIGDQLTWEILLANCNDDDVTIISVDSDWTNKTDHSKIELNKFLQEEWTGKSKKQIALFDSLGEFIKKFPEGSKITTQDIEKEKRPDLEYPWYPVQSAGPISSPASYTPFAGPTGPSGPRDVYGTSTASGVSGSIYSSVMCLQCGNIYVPALSIYTRSICPFCGFQN